jgi:pyruvate dehydrogenase E2 component (dihydrolipoamide acetyltransferase)
MIRVYEMPRLGHLQETGSVIEWRKKPGQPVRKGEILLVVETEKTTVEVEATFDGVFKRILVDSGVEVPVGAPIAEFDEVDAL